MEHLTPQVDAVDGVPQTRHDAAVFAGARWALTECATYDSKGAGWVGGGRPLDRELEQTYRHEADALLADLAAVSQAMTLDDARRLAARLEALARAVRHEANQEDAHAPVPADRFAPDQGQPIARQEIHGEWPPSSRDAGEWTADYRQGGRPITGENEQVGVASHSPGGNAMSHHVEHGIGHHVAVDHPADGTLSPEIQGQDDDDVPDAPDLARGADQEPDEGDGEHDDFWQAGKR